MVSILGIAICRLETSFALLGVWIRKWTYITNERLQVLYAHIGVGGTLLRTHVMEVSALTARSWYYFVVMLHS